MFGSRKRLAAAVGAMSLLTLAACGQGGTDPNAPGSDNASGSGSTSDGQGGGECAAYQAYGDLKGKTISVYTSIVSPEDTPHIESFKKFEQCTGAKVAYEGSREFEKQLPVKIEAGSPPDIAYIPQPGLIQTLVKRFPNKVKPVAAEAEKNVDQYYNKAWRGYGTVKDKYYAVPVGANAKSFVWYSPKAFEENGYEVPKTWDDLMALTDKMVADHPDVKPWCAGIESGEATGWPATDWLEDMMLRTVSPEEYDKWVTHQMPFNDPKVVEALDMAGSILKNDKYVNGGLGDVKSIATTPWGESGLPIATGECFLHRAASFYQANWEEGTKVAEDGDVFAFYLPGKDESAKPMLGGGEFAMAFADRPEVAALQTFLTSPEWSNEKAKVSTAGWISANTELDPNNLKSPIDRLAFELLSDEKTVFRFDGSDLMPGAVGAGSLWKGMTDWITGKSSKEVLDTIESGWPK